MDRSFRNLAARIPPFSLVQQRQASWQWPREQVAAWIKKLTGELPAGVARMAIGRGRAGTIEHVAGELVGG